MVFYLQKKTIMSIFKRRRWESEWSPELDPQSLHSLESPLVGALPDYNKSSLAMD